MAIGTTTAILASSAIAAGGAAISNRQNAQAINRAQDAQTVANQQALNFQRETRDIQLGLAEPFRQFGIQQANALGEVFGFNSVGDGSAGGVPMQGAIPGQVSASALDAYYASNPDIARELQRQQQFGFRNDGVSPAYDANLNGRMETDEFARFRADTFDQGGRNNNPLALGAMTGGSPLMETLPGSSPGQSSASSNPGSVTQVIPSSATGGNPNINTAAQNTAQDRFQGSLFNTALQGQLGRAATGVDANFGAAGDVYSGARMQAQQNTASDLGMSAVNAYLAGMLGQPSTAGAQMASSAAGNFGQNASSIALGSGENAANSAFLRAQNNTGLTQNLTNLANFGLGAFGGGAAPAQQGGSFGGAFGQSNAARGYGFAG